MSDEIEIEENMSEESPVLKEIGEKLRAGREKLGLSINELSVETRLNTQILTALEEYYPSQLPPMTFVLGYIKSYARRVGIPESHLHLERLEPESHIPEVKASLAGPPESSSSDLPVRIVTYLIIISVLVLLALWWVSQKADDGSNTTSNEVLQQDRQQLPPFGNIDKQQLSLPENQNTDTITSPKSPTIVISPPPPVLTSQVEQIEGEDLDSETGSETEPLLSSLTDDTPQSVLTLTYSADSWTEVFDAQKRRLVFGLIKEGRELSLKGEAPFSVFLGYASGVNVSINSEPYYNRQLGRADVARFKVGNENSNRILNNN